MNLLVAENKLIGATALANADNFLTQRVIEFWADEKSGKSIRDKMNAKNIPVPDARFFGVDNLIMLELPQSLPTPAARMKGQRDGLESVIGKIPMVNLSIST